VKLGATAFPAARVAPKVAPSWSSWHEKSLVNQLINKAFLGFLVVMGGIETLQQ
jgi:hypothetical protein